MWPKFTKTRNQKFIICHSFNYRNKNHCEISSVGKISSKTIKNWERLAKLSPENMVNFQLFSTLFNSCFQFSQYSHNVKQSEAMQSQRLSTFLMQ